MFKIYSRFPARKRERKLPLEAVFLLSALVYVVLRVIL